MTDFLLLQNAIDESGIPFATISKRAGIRRETLYNRLKGKGDFTALEITGLCEALHINKSDRERIFFAK